MNRLRTISWASSLFVAAVVGCQLVGCSDDTSTPTGPEDSAADGSQQPEASAVPGCRITPDVESTPMWPWKRRRTSRTT